MFVWVQILTLLGYFCQFKQNELIVSHSSNTMIILKIALNNNNNRKKAARHLLVTLIYSFVKK